jgi:Ca-activated chloride channel family protein
LVTDGEDRMSFYEQKTLFQFLAATDVQIFTIGLTKALKGSSRDKAIKLLTKLGVETGGRTFFPASVGDIEQISGEIINDIRTQYVVGYEPSGGDPGKDFHKVQVTIDEDPKQEKRVAITRVSHRSQRP